MLGYLQDRSACLPRRFQLAFAASVLLVFTFKQAAHALMVSYSLLSAVAETLPPALVLDHLKRTSDAEICVAYLESLFNNVRKLQL